MQRTLNVALKMAIINSRRKQKTIARLARINESQLSHIVAGRRPASEAERSRLAKVLDVPEAELFPDLAVAS